MIYVTGDCHSEFKRFNNTNFTQQNELSHDDYVIVCGDFGGIWDASKQEEWWLNWFSKKPFTLLFIDGNHENFDLLNNYETVSFKGGKAHKIRDNIYHLIRGYVFEIDGSSFFAFGGARSHDIKDGVLDEEEFSSHKKFLHTKKQWSKKGKEFRINHISWWKEEEPSIEEMERGIQNLKEHGNKVDYILTHACPKSIAELLGVSNPNEITLEYLERISEQVEFSHWFFGHYHDEKRMKNYTLLYKSIEVLKK